MESTIQQKTQIHTYILSFHMDWRNGNKKKTVGIFD